MAEEAKWYVVHTYSGYENAVAAAVMKAAENRKMTDLIREVNIPMETVTEITDNGEKTVERKVFPGYVLVKMILTYPTTFCAIEKAPLSYYSLITSTWSSSRSTGVSRPNMETTTLTLFLSTSSASTVPMKPDRGPSMTLTSSPTA